MKHRNFKKCCICNQGMAHNGHILFLRIKVERFGLDHRAIQRAHGMEMILGNAVLANVMGPDEDLAKKIDESDDLLICHDCSEKPLPPYFWMRDKEGVEDVG